MDPTETGENTTVDKATEALLKHELVGSERLEDASIALASQASQLINKVNNMYPEHGWLEYTNDTSTRKLLFSVASAEGDSPDVLVVDQTIFQKQGQKDLNYLRLERTGDKMKVRLTLRAGEDQAEYQFVLENNMVNYKHFTPIGGGFSENQFAEKMENVISLLNEMPTILTSDQGGIELRYVRPRDLMTQSNKLAQKQAKRN